MQQFSVRICSLRSVN